MPRFAPVSAPAAAVLCLGLLWPLLLTPASSAADAPALDTALPTIEAVEIRLDHPTGRPIDLEKSLAFAVGEPLSEEAVRRTLSNFHATGLFDEVEIFRRRGESGLVVVVALYSRAWVDSVELEGELGLRRELLLRRIEQQAGDPLGTDALERSVQALRELYEERGYRRATVSLRVDERDASKRYGVTFTLDSGPRATIGTIDFDGELEAVDAGELRSMLPLETGTPYDRQRIADGVDRLRAGLVKRGYLKADVEAPRESFDADTQTMHLTYPVRIGPKITVQVIGADRDQLLRRGLLPFLDDEIYDAALVKQSSDAIQAHFQRKGHYRVRVSTEEEVRDGQIDLRIRVDPGPVFVLEEIRFEGNRHVAEKELRQLMSTTPQKALAGGKLIDEVLRDDISNLRSFYALQGFSQVTIGPEQVESVGESLTLAIPIHEGPRRRVVHLRFPGVESLDPTTIRDELPLKRGGPFHPVLLDESVNLLRAVYEEEGFADAVVSPQLDWNDAGTLVDVDLVVREGRRSVVDRVILRGHRRTRDEVLHRFAGLREGDTISRRRLLEAERELYRLGIFSEVEVDVTPSLDPSGKRDVVIRLDEGRRWRLAYGFSYHSDDGLGGLLSLSRVNIGGRGDRLLLDLRSNERDRRFRLIFDQPALAGWNVPITYTLFRQDEERESFTVNDTGVQVSLTKDLPRLRLGLTYDYRLVNLLETKVDPQDIDRQDRELEVSSLTPNFFIDRRNDPLDPTRGFLTSMQVEYAFPFLSATADFAKLFVQQAHYAPLGRAGVLALSLRLGAIEPLDASGRRDPLVPEEFASGLIPVSERFFAGGRTTHRAYERDTLGVVGETLLDIGGEQFEAGGNGLFLANLDYRFPIAGSFGGTAFLDLGNVWADWRDFDPDDLKPGMGLGLRYQSPIGPVRLEIGWKLDPEPEEDRSAVFFLSLGNPF